MRLLTTGALLAGAGWLVGCGASLDNQASAVLANPETTLGATERPASAAQFKTADSVGSAKQLKATADPQGNAKQLRAAADALTSAATPGNSAYKIGPLDVLDVTVFKVKELSSSVQVAESGTINLPLVGEIRAAGRTAQEIERDLEKQLGAKYLQSPQVTVYVKEYNSQRLTVEGAVKMPGVYPLKGRTTLLQAIAMAQGQNQEIASSNVLVFRQTAGQRSVARFDVDEIRAGQAEDPVMQQGDVVIVDTSSGKVAFNNFVKVIPATNLFTLLKPF